MSQQINYLLNIMFNEKYMFEIVSCKKLIDFSDLVEGNSKFYLEFAHLFSQNTIILI